MPIASYAFKPLLLVAGSSAAAQTNVDAFVQQTMSESGIPGLSIAVIKAGKVVKANATSIIVN